MIRVPLDLHGARGHAADIIVEDVDGEVSLTLDAEQPGDRPQDDQPVDRTLRPHEARALAAALWHYAAEAER
ncbi:MAG TPA: hypothetical protein VHK88_19980 [Aquihabitans sp.]|jgi:hypothetical protein|nr:hypothetical protein [Aquihabitans sp.]